VRGDPSGWIGVRRLAVQHVVRGPSTEWKPRSPRLWTVGVPRAQCPSGSNHLARSFQFRRTSASTMPHLVQTIEMLAVDEGAERFPDQIEVRGSRPVGSIFRIWHLALFAE
jgi:hypothetical protein